MQEQNIARAVCSLAAGAPSFAVHRLQHMTLSQCLHNAEQILLAHTLE